MKYWYSMTPLAAHLVRLGHFDDQIGLGNPPAFREARPLWKLRRVAFGNSVVDPFVDAAFFLVGEPAVVLEFSILGVGEPGRHSLVADHFTDRLGPADGVAVRCQREGSDFACLMAA